MTALAINLDGNLGEDFDPKTAIEGELVAMSALAGGMQSGRASVSFRIKLPDGREVFAQTSMRLFLNAANAFCARHGNQGTGIEMRATGKGDP